MDNSDELKKMHQVYKKSKVDNLYIKFINKEANILWEISQQISTELYQKHKRGSREEQTEYVNGGKFMCITSRWSKPNRPMIPNNMKKLSRKPN